MSALQAIFTVVGRVFLSTIFLLSAVGNKIPKFEETATTMDAAGVPFAQLMLAGAIVFLIAGSLSIILGFQARIGAVLLSVFLVLATYYFHPFWRLEGFEQQIQMIHFMKNLGLLGAMLFIIGNGSGPMSLDQFLIRQADRSAAARV